MSNPEIPEQFFDNDQVLTDDGKIFRVIGNVASSESFIGFNLYAPDAQGERTFRGEPYARRRVEDAPRPFGDALEAYGVVAKSSVVEHFDALQAAQDGNASFQGTVWHDLYEGLVEIFGRESVGVLGSALPGLHLNGQGKVRNDVDFFIEGLANIPLLRQHLPAIRQRYGFTEYTSASEAKIMDGWKQVFTRPTNSYDKIMARRWSGMQIVLDAGRVVLNTFRFRDTSVHTSLDVVSTDRVIATNVSLDGHAVGSDKANLWPRTFTLDSGVMETPVHMLWWKFNSPVREGDALSLTGDLVDIDGQEALRITNYDSHSIHIHS